MSVVFGKVFSIFLIIGVGYIATKVNVLPMESNKYLVDLLILITSPCMIINSLATQEFEAEMLTATIQALVGACLYFLLLTLACYLVFRKILKFTPKEDISTYVLIFASMNCGFIGFPVTLSLFGNEILYLMILVNIGHTIYQFPFASIQIRLNAGHHLDMGIKGVITSIVNPCTIATILGLLVMFLHLSLPSFLLSSIETIGDSTVPIAMLLIGMQLSNSNFGHIFKNRKLVVICFSRMFILPVVMFLILNWLPIVTAVKVTLIFASCFASGVIIVPLIEKEGGDSLLAAEGVALTTFLSLFILPLSAVFLISYYGISI